VLGAESVFMVRISYERNGETHEAKCRKSELGI